MKGAVIFDRDGTLTRDDGGYTHLVSDLALLPGAKEAVQLCRAAGVPCLLVTNQAGLARGKFSLAQYESFQKALQEELEVSFAGAAYFCPFHEDGSVPAWTVANHPDRKPNPGMLRRAALEWDLHPAACTYIGDKESDVQAAVAAGMVGVQVAPGQLLAAVQAALARIKSFSPAFFADAQQNAAAALRDRATRARAWLFDKALPMWYDQGFDRSTGSFFERLDFATGAPVTSFPRRVRVQARQTFVYAHAGAVLGWPGPWREAAAAGVKILLEKGIHADGKGTNYLLDGNTATVSDPRKDLYDVAFVLFALAHAGKALGDENALARAKGLLDWLLAEWARPEGGFHEGEVTPCPPFRQNPHMHMLESILALFDATGDESLLQVHARGVVDLFATRFTDSEGGALLEYFDQNWSPLDERVTEPGHQFEWAWLIDRASKLGVPGADGAASKMGRRIHLHGEVYGVNTVSNAVYDEVWLNGVVKTPTSRFWPHTERIKANVVWFERTGDVSAALCAVNAFDKLMSYCSPEGLWRDRLQADGKTFIEEASPASSFYHYLMAISELIRVAKI